MNTRAKLLIHRDGRNPLVLHPSAEEEMRMVRDVMRKEYVFCHVDDPYELTLQKMRELGLPWLPVLDAHRKIVGIVTLPADEKGEN